LAALVFPNADFASDPLFARLSVGRLLAGRGWNGPVQPDCLGDPFVDSSGSILNSFDGRAAIGHAAGKIRHSGEKSAAVLWRQRLDPNFVVAAHRTSLDFKTKPTKALM
jgi:hypothetical protein